jgi:hypothetical protein
MTFPLISDIKELSIPKLCWVGARGTSMPDALNEPKILAAEPKSSLREEQDVPLIPAYKLLLSTVFVTSVGIIGILVFAFFFASSAAPSITVIVIISGALGAVFSSLIRLYNFQDLPAALMRRELKDLNNAYVFIYAIVPIVVGSIAAALVYVIMASGLVSGSLFPFFYCKSNQCASFQGLLEDWGPKETTDYAKAIVWGFISGFAERFVPDTLNRLALSGSEQKKP